MKTVMILGFILASISANAANLKCVNSDYTLVLETSKKSDYAFYARLETKSGGGFYDGGCKVISKNASFKTLECEIEAYWEVFEPIAVIELATDKKTATVATADRRFAAGYSLDKKQTVVCSPTTETAGI